MGKLLNVSELVSLAEWWVFNWLQHTKKVITRSEAVPLGNSKAVGHDSCWMIVEGDFQSFIACPRDE